MQNRDAIYAHTRVRSYGTIALVAMYMHTYAHMCSQLRYDSTGGHVGILEIHGRGLLRALGKRKRRR